jgi:hypothetical protein
MLRSYKSVITLCAAALCMLNGCSPVAPVSDGGVEAGNPRVVGALFEQDGTPSSGTIALLIPESYIATPGKASEAIRSDTTDTLGTYRFSNIPAGRYTLQAKTASTLKRTLVRNIVAETSHTTTVAGDTVRDAGTLRIVLPDSLKNEGGTIAIPGTTIAVAIGTTSLSGNIVEIDSLPAGMLPPVVYIKDPTAGTLPRTLADSISIPPGGTVSASALPGKRSTVQPGDNVQAAIDALLPGDTLYISKGIYRLSGLSLSVSGNSAQPILICAVQGDTAVFRDPDAGDNCINIADASYVTLQGLEIDSLPPYIDGIKFVDNAACDHITIRDCRIHSSSGNGINAMGGHHHISLIRNHLHHLNGETPTAIRLGTTSGAAPNNWIIDNNLIHDIGDSVVSSGDGISIRTGCHSILVRDNVMYRCWEAGIINYGIGGSNPGGSLSSTIEANAIWSATEGIGAYGDVTVTNNIVFNCQTLINSYGYSTPTARFVAIYNNTIYNGDSLFLTDWDSTDIFTNNAVYLLQGATIRGSGQIDSNIGDAVFTGMKPGKLSADMHDPVQNAFWPKSGSALIDAASGAATIQVDFYGTTRDGKPDVGAIEFTDATTMHKAIIEGFKK